MNLRCFYFRVVVAEHIKTRGDRTKEKINWLMDLERRAFTLNTHNYSNYKDSFLSYYRASREEDGGPTSQLVKKLHDYRLPTTVWQHPNEFQDGLTRVMSGLPQVGINGVKAADLAKLLPPDPMEPALNIMAGVRAYFQSWFRYSCSITTAAHSECLQLRTRGS
jgi:hypothetical protein